MSRALIEELVATVEQRDADRFAALFAQDAIAYHPLHPDPLVGRDAIRDSEQALFESFSDVGVEVRSVLASEERCAAELVLRATNTGPLELGEGEPLPATGRVIELSASWWYDLAPDGLIAEARDYFDTAVLMDQLGLSDTASIA